MIDPIQVDLKRSFLHGVFDLSIVLIVIAVGPCRCMDFFTVHIFFLFRIILGWALVQICEANASHVMLAVGAI